jgi:hypothetical protein
MVDPSGPGADYVINLIIEDNKRAVRFLQDPQKAVTGISTGAIDTEYRMTASGSEGAISVRLTDLKGREVASENATYQPGDTTENRDAAASDVADRLNPLLSIIRDSQRHIREEDKSAIAAYMVLTPEDQTVRMAQRAKIKAEVKDCDGAVLSGRESGVELSGPGAVSPMTFEATGSLTYSSPEEGTASITAFWEYETVAGRPNVATGSATVTVKDRPIGTGSPIVANFARSAELLGRFHQLPMVDQK